MKYIFLPILFFAYFLFLSCQSKESQYNEDAHALGEKHAQELIDRQLSERELMAYLLDVKVRQSQINEKINSQAAQCYIDAFKSYIQQHSDSLARIIIPDTIR